MKSGDELTVSLPVYAEYLIRVKVTDEMIGDDGEVDFDLVMDEAYDNLPSGLCYGCSTGNSGIGFRERHSVSLELDDSPEVHYILDEDGNTVWGDPSKKLGW